MRSTVETLIAKIDCESADRPVLPGTLGTPKLDVFVCPESRKGDFVVEETECGQIAWVRDDEIRAVHNGVRMKAHGHVLAS
jgi:hypothetical protein